MAQTNPLPVPMGPWKITVYDQENFQGKRMEFTSACPNIMECGFDNIRSLKVECGAQSGNAFGITQNCLPQLGSSQNHKESKITVFEKDNFIGRQWELVDDYPSLQAMGWANNEVGSMKIQCGAWVCYQYPGYRGYQYVLEADHHGGDYKHWREWGSHAQTSQIQSIRRLRDQQPSCQPGTIPRAPGKLLRSAIKKRFFSLSRRDWTGPKTSVVSYRARLASF
ncbi:PREDICTED: beta-crystallin A3 [Apaloderma vittatum]|uniref:beta-crystallin A3 n=1 Tax=Apaloderma vittatum TaxID=57397 RepID=UPI0005212E85|nr:PREDICTED: beta-crystallin A3 [Apaloderma vittatum]